MNSDSQRRCPFPIEQILSGCESVPRNPTIAQVFRLPGWAEIAGSGMMKIFDNWQAAGYVPPVIRNNEPTHWFTIEFSEKSLGLEKEAVGPDETAQKSTQKTAQKQQETPGKTPGKIMELLKDNPTLSIPELAEKIKKSESAVERAIRKLRQAGLLKRVGPAKEVGGGGSYPSSRPSSSHLRRNWRADQRAARYLRADLEGVERKEVILPDTRGGPNGPL